MSIVRESRDGVVLRYPSSIREEELKNRVAADWFGVWTEDDTKNARIFLERGVDAVTTNRSKEIAEELKDHHFK